MSDPITNVDIEDVLSSIRRLVSEQPVSPERPSPGKLVLTPAFRVAPPPEAENPGASSRSGGPGCDDQQTLEDRIAELEQAVAASASEWEPDGSEAGASTLPHDFPPVFSAKNRTGPPAQPWPAQDDAETSELFDDTADSDADETILDEEMLRDMVAEIVREELQGALGERITRNVRKLVRAEISRALATRDFN